MRDVSLKRSEPCSEEFKKSGTYILDRSKDYVEKIKEKCVMYGNSHHVRVQ